MFYSLDKQSMLKWDFQSSTLLTGDFYKDLPHISFLIQGSGHRGPLESDNNSCHINKDKVGAHWVSVVVCIQMAAYLDGDFLLSKVDC